jgi:hypothetical protein
VSTQQPVELNPNSAKHLRAELRYRFAHAIPSGQSGNHQTAENGTVRVGGNMQYTFSATPLDFRVNMAEADR